MFKPCPGCGYDLAGIAPGVCPECARPFTERELQRVLREQAWGWAWLDESLRLTFWLWIGMLFGLLILRAFEGQGLIGWVSVAAIAVIGVAFASWHRRRLKRLASVRTERSLGPNQITIWSVMIQAGAAILIALPIAGTSLLIVIGGLLGWLTR